MKKKLKYSPDYTEKMRKLKKYLEFQFGGEVLLIYHGICPGHDNKEANDYWEKYKSRIGKCSVV